jgi:hypothetical protein
MENMAVPQSALGVECRDGFTTNTEGLIEFLSSFDHSTTFLFVYQDKVELEIESNNLLQYLQESSIQILITKPA